MDEPVLRLFRFKPVRTAFDRILRDILIPDLNRMPGMTDVYVGRQGPDELGWRVTASVWTSEAAMTAAVGVSFDDPIFHPEYLHETTERGLDFHPIAISIRSPGDEPAGIMRIARGRVRPGELDDYVEEVRLGTESDVASGHGPLLLALVAEPPDAFITFSIWRDWVAIERATGSDVHRPIATRHPERIVEWDLEHYEIVPSLPRPAMKPPRIVAGEAV